MYLIQSILDTIQLQTRLCPAQPLISRGRGLHGGELAVTGSFERVCVRPNTETEKRRGDEMR